MLLGRASPHQAECLRADLRNVHDVIFRSYDLIGAKIVFVLRLWNKKIAGRMTKIVCFLFLAEFNRSA
jgi:hypothetical protein